MLVWLVASACAPAGTSGGLWALDEAELERDVFRQSDAERLNAAVAHELAVVDAILAAETARLGAALADCPTPGRPALGVSAGDRARDQARAKADAPRRQRLASLALADWWLRRAATAGDASLCQLAGSLLANQAADARGGRAATPPDSETASLWQRVRSLPPMLAQRQDAAPRLVVIDLSADDVQTPAAWTAAIADYTLAQVDGVRAPAPLPAYLVAVYGGTLVVDGVASHANVEAGPELQRLVDRLAPSLPDWEPDALLASLQAAGAGALAP
jgi:hypothetical protein